MAVVTIPAFLQNAGNVHTAEITRNAFAGVTALPRAGGSLVSRGGVVPDLGSLGTELAVTQNGTPNMSVNVGSGVVYVPGTEGIKQGVYAVINDATLNVSITASDPTQARIDLIVATVRDTAYSGASNDARIIAVTGTPSGSPVAPTAPANSVTLAQIAVGAGVTSIVNANITDARFFAASIGGTIKCTSLTRPTLMGLGQTIYELDTNQFRYWNGSEWRLKVPVRFYNTLSGTAASVSFDIPSNLRVVRCSWTCRSNVGAVAQFLRIRVNGNTGNNYNSSFTQAAGVVGAVDDVPLMASSYILGGVISGANATADYFSSGTVEFQGWDNPHTNNLGCTIVSQMNMNTGNFFACSGGGHYTGNGPYTSFSLLPEQDANSFIAGSQFVVEAWD